MSSLEKGNLAHAILERIDFAADRAAMVDSCRRSAGLFAADPSSTDIGEVVDNVVAFAHSAVGRTLAAMKLSRELPFILQLKGSATYYIKGAMDLVAEGNDTVTVYDYKYVSKEDAHLDGYRFQLRTYMLAITTRYPGKQVAGKLIFLKGGQEERVECNFAAFERILIEIMDTITSLTIEAEFSPKEQCMEPGCSFRSRCKTALFTSPS